MNDLRVGVIGCGKRGGLHARGYSFCENTVISACADPMDEPRGAFIQAHKTARPYTDYREMLEKEDLDIVSVCTWTGTHREIIDFTASSGVKAIHSEKPMATTWGDAKAIIQSCEINSTVITFCHQRRLRAEFIKAKEIANSGAIGDVYRYEGSCANLFDWGTHWFDMFFFYNNDEPAEWVLGQIDIEGTVEVFGVPCEGSGLSWIRYANGREGLLATGGAGMDENINRIIGTDGIIEIRTGNKEEPLRAFIEGTWHRPDLSGIAIHENSNIATILDLVDALNTGREPALSGRKALQATELIFATYESSRRRGKVILPLDADDSALIAMLERPRRACGS